MPSRSVKNVKLGQLLTIDTSKEDFIANITEILKKFNARGV